MRNVKLISLLELSIIVLSVIAFSYFVSTNLPEVLQHPGESKIIQFLTKPIMPVVSAAPYVNSVCCKETTSGALCQDIMPVDSSLCKTDLIGTGCQTVKECQKGCCYDSESGICTLNAPQGKCLFNGGKWDVSATCNIPECQLGCCVLGDGAAMMSTRECSVTSDQYKIKKDFRPLDSKGSCDIYSDLSSEGACLTDSGDYSGLKNCIFTTKEKCISDGSIFKKDYLCTSKELNTTCEKTEKTTCIDGKDQVYFVDSCGNKANVYDSRKSDDQSYWEKVIFTSQSCNGNPADCGNCDYSTGSICTKYYSGKDMAKPTIGAYSCRNLNCANGKKHGESWCVSDASNNTFNGFAVGTRNYVAKCFEGEIQLEGCADFNQQVCLEYKDTTYSSYSQATCVMNDWRSCINANDADNYADVKHKCDQLPQCVMFNDIPGNEIYKNLPGFKEISNDAQGRAGKVGAGMNKIITYCVPRFTPGYQFWNTDSKNAFSSTNTQKTSTTNYGGSMEETNKICSLGSFTCSSHIITTTPLVSPTRSDAENPECNSDSAGPNQVPLMMEALNERCRSLGSCGIQYNLQEKIGRSGFSVDRVYIDKKGGMNKNYSNGAYIFNETYLNSTLKTKQSSLFMGKIKNLSQLVEIDNPAMTMEFPSDSSNGTIPKNSAQDISSPEYDYAGGMNWGAAGVGALAYGAAWLVSESYIAGTATTSAGVATPTLTSAAWIFAPIVYAAAGFVVGQLVGGMIAKSSGMTPGETTAFVGAMSGVGGAVGVGIGWIALGCAFPIICVVLIVLVVLYAIYSLFTGEDHEYYIQTFECKAWQPPLSGNCESCNTDVRPCSEDKCRTLGNNCKYFVDNGEPGYCATLASIWSAKISPWNESLTAELKYINITNMGFKIIGNLNSKEVPAWKPVKFGIQTDDPAICKLDTNHSKKYDEMQYTLKSDKNYLNGKIDNLHHSIVLSPFTISGESELDQTGTNPPLKEGDNSYYIICQNFAGQVNEAPFVVSAKQADGPDLSPAEITRFSPEEKSYVPYGNNSVQFWMYLNEPAECRYSIEYDQNYYSDMPYNFSCITDPALGFYGEWPCTAYLNNVTSDMNLFIKCKDQPAMNETDLLKRNVNSVSIPYSIQACKTGLDITSVSPTDPITLNGTSEIDLKITTTGCIDGGKATCYYKVPEFGNSYSLFFDTGNTIHNQAFTEFGNGTHAIFVECQDAAGNKANLSTNITVLIDKNSPVITRVFTEKQNIVLMTNKEANCAISTNETQQCDFDIKNTGTFSTKYSINVPTNSKAKTLYIRCADKNGNKPVTCTQIIKLVNLKNEV